MTLHVFTYTEEITEDNMLKWLCERNITFNYRYTPTDGTEHRRASNDWWTFENEDDALLFSLAWSEYISK